MKKDVLRVIDKIIKLLTSCSLDKEASWFKDSRDKIMKYPSESREYKNQLKKVNSILAGMGSFSDLPMCPKPNSGLSEDEADKQQWNLTAELGDEIRKELKSN